MTETTQLIADLAVWFIAFLFSLTCHEAAHAFAAKLGGDDTASSQVTLDPTPHMRREPFGTLIVPIASFLLQGGGWMIGWASAPYDPRWAERFPRRAALMAAAGPLANFVLVLLAVVAIRIGVAQGWFVSLGLMGGALDRIVVGVGGEPTAASMFVSVLFSLNLILGFFNLIPVPPLDGHAIVPLLLTDRARHKWFQLFAGVGSMMGLLIAWVAFDRLFGPIFRQSVHLLLQ